MLVNAANRWVFVSTPKCATNTLYSVLPGVRVGEFHDIRVNLFRPDIERWTVCRSPYGRAMSLWMSTCARDGPDRYGFRALCDEPSDPDSFAAMLASGIGGSRDFGYLLMSQTAWHAKFCPHRVLRLETLRADLAQIPGVDIVELPVLNSTDRTTKLSHIGKAHVREWAAEDFKRYGYAR